MAALRRGELPAAPFVRGGALLRRLAAALGARLNRLSYLRRWLILGVLIGLIAGAGAIVFYEALMLATRELLGALGGWHPPPSAGEGSGTGSGGHFVRPWAIPLVAGAGGLFAGWLVFTFAPEAEGHGTDAAIHAVHHNPRGIRLRAVVVKIIASAITIGSGGSGGREGPTGQISAGFGSLLARLLDLSPEDARIAVSTGIGSGIGAIFRAPLGGAVLASEIVYREDVDPTVLVPSFVASIVAFAVFSGVEGFTPVFGYTHYRFGDPAQLGWFAILGILAGLMGLLYAKGFYGLAALFSRIRLPRAVLPGIGGLCVGALGLAIPEVLNTGYGFVQQALTPRLAALPLWIVVVVPFARIVATGLSIGSGGSGGIFGPGMVIGAFTGAAFWRLGEGFLPAFGHNATPYVIIGMAACFGSIARAPLAVLLMVAEMTGTLQILAPAMVAVGIATLIVSRNDDSIYRSQPRSRDESAASRIVAAQPLLTTIRVSEAMCRPRLLLEAPATVAGGRRALLGAGVRGAPLLDGSGRLAGTVEVARLTGVGDDESLTRYADATSPTLRPEMTLDVGLDAIATSAAGWVPVVDDERRVIGIVALSDVNRAYHAALQVAARAAAHGLAEPA